MTTTATERPQWRDVNIDLLAQKLYEAHTMAQWGATFTLASTNQTTVDAWNAVAEAAVDELIDRPEREFQAQCDAVLGRPAHIGSWTPASASDWLPEHA